MSVPGRTIRSYKFRVRATEVQHSALSEMLRDFCSLYNAGLQQRIEAYRRRGLSIQYRGQAAELKAVREAEPNLARWSFTALQLVLYKLDTTFSAFFRRGHGFPRFRSSDRYRTANFRVGDGLSLKKTGRFSVVGVPGTLKVIWHRDLPSNAKLGNATLSRQNGKWFIIFWVESEFGGGCGVDTVGIDLGLNALIATSDGETVEAPRFARKAHKDIRRRQRALARCKRGSKRRLAAKARLAISAARVANQRRDFAHKLSRSLVSRYQGIALEKLNMASLKRSMLARSIHDAAWSQFVEFIKYKAASAGADVKLVDPRGTSQTCPSCGNIKAKTLKIRTHSCECGTILDRDVAAAMIIHQRAFGFPQGRCGRTLTGQDAA